MKLCFWWEDLWWTNSANVVFSSLHFYVQNYWAKVNLAKAVCSTLIPSGLSQQCIGCLAGIHSGGRGGNEKREAPKRGEDEKRTDRFPVSLPIARLHRPG